VSGAVRRPGLREGYDLWAATYDQTANPLVALDRRVTFPALSPGPGELILDAGCGTGYYVTRMLHSGAWCVGMDLSLGMMAKIRAAHPDVPLIQCDLDAPFPLRNATFDAVLSALVSEHIRDLPRFCSDVARVLRPGGRFIWSVFHPGLAHAGTEANFPDSEGNEVRLGAELHSVEDYKDALSRNGLVEEQWDVMSGDAELSAAIPRAAKYEGRPMLIVVRAVKKR